MTRSSERVWQFAPPPVPVLSNRTGSGLPPLALLLVIVNLLYQPIAPMPYEDIDEFWAASVGAYTWLDFGEDGKRALPLKYAPRPGEHILLYACHAEHNWARPGPVAGWDGNVERPTLNLDRRRRLHLARLPACRQDGQRLMRPWTHRRIRIIAKVAQCIVLASFGVFLLMSSDTNLQRSDSDRSQKAYFATTRASANHTPLTR